MGKAREAAALFIMGIVETWRQDRENKRHHEWAIKGHDAALDELDALGRAHEATERRERWALHELAASELRERDLLARVTSERERADKAERWAVGELAEAQARELDLLARVTSERERADKAEQGHEAAWSRFEVAQNDLEAVTKAKMDAEAKATAWYNHEATRRKELEEEQAGAYLLRLKVERLERELAGATLAADQWRTTADGAAAERDRLRSELTRWQSGEVNGDHVAAAAERRSIVALLNTVAERLQREERDAVAVMVRELADNVSNGHHHAGGVTS